MRATTRSTAGRLLGAIGRTPGIAGAVRIPALRALLERVPGAHALYASGWERIHPFDRTHGTDTSGFVAPSELPADEGARAHAVCYAGSQPSLLRTVLATLPAVDGCTFLDLGCGKGRALLVAAEFPFREIIGVELSAPLARIAMRNAVRSARRFPQRTAISVAVADASTFPLPTGDLVLFMYHPFGAELVATVVARVEAALRARPRRIYIVYYNPVAGHCFDGSKLLRRRYARALPYAPEERGYGPDASDVVVIWQNGAAARPTAANNAGARIVVAPGGMRAVLEN